MWLQDDGSPIQAGGRGSPWCGQGAPWCARGGAAEEPHLVQTRLQTRAPSKHQTANISIQWAGSIQPILLEMSLGPLPADHTGRSQESFLPLLAGPAPYSLPPSLCSILPSCRSGLRAGVQSQALTVTPLPLWTTHLNSSSTVSVTGVCPGEML